jgi:gamma-glutamyl-gamma-aminobutyrate hydrolase PuuD
MGSMAKPLVGITTYVTPARFGAWELDSALIPYDYVRAVERAGARAVLVPPSDDGIDEILDAVDGLVFSGGSDLDPELYGQEAHPETTGVVPERDSAELALLRAALERDVPVLAICRGSQILNVALGGDLVQHLPDHVGHDGHKEVAGTFSEHDVAIEPDTRLAGIVGDRAPIKSHHHQGLARIGSGLRPSARDEDGWVEAVEVPDRRFAVGVLWHPEAGDDARLFEALVAEAAEYRALRRG